jgi:4-aminobutyrate aminotransferase-like enzyme
VLEVVQEERLQAHAFEVGERLLTGLRDLQQRHESIGDVRGSGFFIGVELMSNAVEAAGVVNQMRERGILLGTDGPHHNVLKIRPPMPFSEADADQLLRTLDDVLST